MKLVLFSWNIREIRLRFEEIAKLFKLSSRYEKINETVFCLYFVKT